MKNPALVILLIAQFIFLACVPTSIKNNPYDYSSMNRATKLAYKRVDQFLQDGISNKTPVKIVKHSKIDTVVIDRRAKQLDIYLNDWFGSMPFREANTALLYAGMKIALRGKFKKYDLSIYANQQPIEELVPNYYRRWPSNYDRSRMPDGDTRSYPLVRNISKPWQPSKGLYTRNIALWPSHGWYYEQKLDRWEWQRARVFQTVEDLLPFAFVTQYLLPMLENAGAQVFLPRERDIQTNEVVIDNDTPNISSSYHEYILSGKNTWEASDTSGFAVGSPPYKAGVNPFQTGTYRFIKSDKLVTAGIRWIPDIPESGEYGVYISYSAAEDNLSDAHYTVYHSGGKTEFLVNQQMGGNTWIYLGKFNFKEGLNPEKGQVELTNQSAEAGKTLTADAVRFGGGMGNISRNGKTSGRPRYIEAARYYLQYAGMPDTLVFNLNDDENDYNDDYQCRGEWVNYLKGAPFGPNKDRSAEGLNIPVDLSFGFHTDAGFTRNDTVVGTLSIFSSNGYNSETVFPDSMSRLANRDFADILQSQIVDDIRAKYDPAWNRRWLWDRGYSEAYRPNVPAALLELLSHQNFLDMKFGLDPDFRFHSSRSIYKAMLRFLATQYQFEYQVQPLPVSHFQATLNKNGQALLKWKPTEDPLEETAKAEQYIVYTRRADNAFDNGVLVESAEFRTDQLEPGEIYSFKISAVNGGGESFPSEILAVCYLDNENSQVLIVNGFDRVSAPATLETDKYLGFMNIWDQGVPDKYDLDFTGDQYDLLAASPWLDDDAPGHGASNADYETTIIPGNTFDFPFVHGESVKAAGHSFVSTSDEAVMDSDLDITQYKYVDLILGEEKTTDGPKPRLEKRFQAFPKQLQAELRRYCSTNGNLLITGAYVGTDLFESRKDFRDVEFAQDVLKYKFRTDHAVNSGGVISADSTFIPVTEDFKFNTVYHPELYTVESSDAIEPADTSATTILRYAENNTSAAVAHQGTTDIIIFGFPFETIISTEHRDQVMSAVLEYFDRPD